MIKNSKIDALAERIIKDIKQNDIISKKLFKLAQEVYTDALKKVDLEGYCMRFNIPEKEVVSLLDDLNITEEELKEAFNKDLGFPKNAYMYGNPYYQLLLLLLYVYTKLHRTKEAKAALFLILTKMWNGLKYKYIKYCKKEVMDYVINRLVNKRFLAYKYKNPLELIVNYFVETIYKKYSKEILQDIDRLRILFNQCWNRLNQLFSSQRKNGLAHLYYKAYEEGLAYGKTMSNVEGEDEEVLSAAELESKNARLFEIIKNTIQSILFDTNKEYPENFVNFTILKTRLRRQLVEDIYKELHNIEYRDKLEDALAMILQTTNIENIQTLCSKDIYDKLEKKLIISKNTKLADEFKKICYEILDKLFLKLKNKSFEKVIHKAVYYRLLLFFLLYHLQKVICKGNS